MRELLGGNLAAGQGITLLKNKIVGLLYCKYVMKPVGGKRLNGPNCLCFYGILDGVRKDNACTFFL